MNYKPDNIQIINYKPEHRRAVRTICCDTGIAGDPMDEFFGSRKLFADMFTLYFTDFNSNYNFVAWDENKKKVVGYLLGCLDTHQHNEIYKKKVVPKILKRILSGEYGFSKATLRHLKSRIKQLIYAEHKIVPPLNKYPAHLHINLDRHYRRFGLGGKLMQNYFNLLKEKNICGVHLGTTSLNTQAIPFYENKFCFKLFAKFPTCCYEGLLSQKVYNLIYVKDLD